RQGVAPVSPPITSPALRLLIDPYLRPTQKEKCRVHVEADNAPLGAKIKVEFQRTRDGKFTSQGEFSSDRNQRVGFTPQRPGGGLLFQTTVEDWYVPLDTKGIQPGKRELRGRLLKDNKDVIPPEVKELVFDDTKPKRVQFLTVNGQDVPPQDPNADPVSVKVR